VAEREAPGEFDYLFNDPADDEWTGDARATEPDDLDYRFSPDDDLWDDPDDNFWARGPDSADTGFDAFDANTWHFMPAPAPWYRTKQAVTALIATAAAMAAIVVSGVLLVFRTPATAVDETPSPGTQPAPTSAAPATLASSATPPPPPPSATQPPPPPSATQPPPPPSATQPPPPPPPPQTSASSVNTAPDVNYPRVQPRPTKEPEIGVTRTPATRSPISVAPQPRR
jgi:hypothetical protein